MSHRIDATFKALRATTTAAYIPFVMAGDGGAAQSLALLHAHVEHGADLLELGMPFSDPMADGPAVQAAAQRALRHRQSLDGTLAIVRRFRDTDVKTPLILMGYYNPIFRYGPARFAAAAAVAGVDGLIVVDLPPEADNELCLPALQQGLAFIRLVTPTTDETRLATLLKNASGFLYAVAVRGVTGTKSAVSADVAALVSRVKKQTNLPICVGFGVKTAETASHIAKNADGVVVASALLDRLAPLSAHAGQKPDFMADYAQFSRDLANAIHGARRR